MLATLLESSHIAARRSGATTFSVAAHATLMTLAVLATARAGTRLEPPKPERIVFAQPAPPPPPPTPPTPTVAPTAPTVPVDALTLRAPIEIPNVIPDIDYTRTVTDPSRYTGLGNLGLSADSLFAPRTRGSAIGDSVPPNWKVDKAAFALSGQTPPVYPNVLRQSRVEGEVDVQFVVDTLGRADMSTLKILSSPHELFSKAVRDALPRMLYSPALIGTTKVRVMVQQAFSFVIRG